MTLEDELRHELKNALERNDLLAAEIKDMKERLDALDKITHAIQSQQAWKKAVQETIGHKREEPYVYITTTTGTNLSNLPMKSGQVYITTTDVGWICSGTDMGEVK